MVFISTGSSALFFSCQTSSLAINRSCVLSLTRRLGLKPGTEVLEVKSIIAQLLKIMDKTLVSWHNFSILLMASSFISSSNKKDYLYSLPTPLLHKKCESSGSQKQRMTIESPLFNWNLWLQQELGRGWLFPEASSCWIQCSNTSTCSH